MSSVPIEKKRLIRVIRKMLSLSDVRLMDHGERVGYLVWKMLRANGATQDEIQTAVLLALFHDIGAYKTEEIDRMVEFETDSVYGHSVYGYLFMHSFTPLRDYADVILYHHVPYQSISRFETEHRFLASLIHLADRTDLLVMGGGDLSVFKTLSGTMFDPQLVELLFRAEKQFHVCEALRSGAYSARMEVFFEQLKLTSDEVFLYVKLLAYSIDFRNTTTVSHTIHMAAIAVSLARRMGLSEKACERIHYGALLHDVGKIAIPERILEFDGKLSEEDFAVMRTHVSKTREILEGEVAEDIVRIASRHHEKADGSGYPLGLTAEELTLPEQIVALSDMMEALSSQRSYKPPFPQEKVLSIVREMQERGQLDSALCDTAIREYGGILEETLPVKEMILEKYRQIKEDEVRILRELERTVEETNL